MNPQNKTKQNQARGCRAGGPQPHGSTAHGNRAFPNPGGGNCFDRQPPQDRQLMFVCIYYSESNRQQRQTELADAGATVVLLSDISPGAPHTPGATKPGDPQAGSWPARAAEIMPVGFGVGFGLVLKSRCVCISKPQLCLIGGSCASSRPEVGCGPPALARSGAGNPGRDGCRHAFPPSHAALHWRDTGASLRAWRRRAADPPNKHTPPSSMPMRSLGLRSVINEVHLDENPAEL